MYLSPAERDRLLIFSAAELARRRRADGVLLNVPESIALVADTVCEVARRGGRHAEALDAGQHALTQHDVMPEVPYIVTTVAVEAVFMDGSRLVVVPEPFGPVAPNTDMPGAILAADQVEAVVDSTTIEVENTADVPISVTSHFHFFEANARLRFSRALAYGTHLNVPAGTHVHFGPGERRLVDLVAIRGSRVVVGFAGLVDGPLDEPGVREQALARARAWGFLDTGYDGDADAAQAAARAISSRAERGRP